MKRGASAPWIALLLAAAPACAWSVLDPVAPPPAIDASLIDVAVPDDAPGGDAPADAPPSNAACLASGEPELQWSFDASLDGWFARTDPGVTASATWTGTVGHPAPGAASLAAMPGDGSNQGAWLTMNVAADLAQRTVSAWVWLDSGASPRFKLYVQTGSQYTWADGGTVDLPLHAWACVSLNLAAPSYEGPGYDPTQVIAVGFETMAIEPFHLFVDTVTVD
jgi:hypothetical protein